VTVVETVATPVRRTIIEWTALVQCNDCSNFSRSSSRCPTRTAPGMIVDMMSASARRRLNKRFATSVGATRFPTVRWAAALRTGFISGIRVPS
jgi:hypothetical protein